MTPKWLTVGGQKFTPLIRNAIEMAIITKVKIMSLVMGNQLTDTSLRPNIQAIPPSRKMLNRELPKITPKAILESTNTACTANESSGVLLPKLWRVDEERFFSRPNSFSMRLMLRL